MDANGIIKQLKGIRGPDISWYDGGQVHSLGDAIGQILDKHLRRDQPTPSISVSETSALASPAKTDAYKKTPSPRVSISDFGYAPACPDCHGSLTFAEGFMRCVACGFSKCG